MASKKPKAKTADAPKPLTEKQQAFLEAFRQLGNISAAARFANVSRYTHFKEWLPQPHYAEMFEDARGESSDLLESEAIRRATRGTDEPVFHKGKIVGHVRKYSDVLLIFLMKAANPEKYRENHKMEFSGTVRHVKMYGQEAPVDSV